MADPPSYEESASGYGNSVEFDSKPDPKGPQRFSIREEVGASRSQHVAALVSKLLPQIRDRARNGLSKSMLMLLPSNQGSSEEYLHVCESLLIENVKMPAAKVNSSASQKTSYQS